MHTLKSTELVLRRYEPRLSSCPILVEAGNTMLSPVTEDENDTFRVNKNGRIVTEQRHDHCAFGCTNNALHGLL